MQRPGEEKSEGQRVKYLVDNLHREFYAEKGWIEFEALLSAEEAREYAREALSEVAKRLRLPLESAERLSSEQLFLAGRDLWRTSALMKRLVTHSRLAKMAAALVNDRPLRLIFDQLFLHDTSVPIKTTKTGELQAVSGSLNELTSFQGLHTGLLLCLEAEEKDHPSPLPSRPGSGSFLSADRPFDFTQLFTGPRQTHLLIGYGRTNSLYIYQPDDPHGLALQQLGYSYNDRLVDSLHPIVCR